MRFKQSGKQQQFKIYMVIVNMVYMETFLLITDFETERYILTLFTYHSAGIEYGMNTEYILL